MPVRKTFADDTLLFIRIIDTRSNVPNCDLKSIKSWTYQWKM